MSTELSYKNVYQEILNLISDLSYIYDNETPVHFRYYDNWYLESLIFHRKLELQTITDILRKLEKLNLIVIISYANYTKNELLQVFNMLNQMEDADREDFLKDGEPSDTYEIVINKEFSDYYNSLQSSVKNYDVEKANDTTDKLLWLSLLDTALILNNVFIITTMKFGYENLEVIKYLLDNPNRKVSKDELNEKLKLDKPLKDFSKIVENLKFKGDLKRVFFETSKRWIKLHNPVTQSRLKELEMNYLNLFNEKDL